MWGRLIVFLAIPIPGPFSVSLFSRVFFSTSFPGSLPWLGENPGNVVGLFCVLLFTVIGGYFVTADNPIGS